MPKKVDVLLPNSSQYGVLHHFSKKICEALLRMGFAARLLSVEEYKNSLSLSTPDFTLGFNGAPQDEKGEYFCDSTGILHISCLVDPPYRFLDLQTSPYIRITCDDRHCVDLFRSDKTPHYYFFPHGVESDLAPSPQASLYDLVFLGTFIDPQTRRQQWDKTFPRAVCRAMDDAAEAALHTDNRHFAEIFIERINEKKSRSSFSLIDALQALELYIKARDRIDLLRAITHCRIDVFGGSAEAGGGWQESMGTQKNLVIHPPVEYAEAIKIMQQSKIVLNSGLKNSFGAHERVFSALAAGAVTVTSSNPFLRSSFADEESILFYTSATLNSLEEKLQPYLREEPKRKALSEKGRDLVMKSHTWEARLRDLLPEILG